MYSNAERSAGFSARKRARYWLGSRASDVEDEWGEEDEEEEDEVEDFVMRRAFRSRSMSSNMSVDDGDDGDNILARPERRKSLVRDMNDEVAEAIEL